MALINKRDTFIICFGIGIQVAYMLISSMFDQLYHSFGILCIGVALGVTFSKLGYSFTNGGNKPLLLLCVIGFGGAVLGRWLISALGMTQLTFL